MADQPQNSPQATPNESLISPGGKMPQTQATDPTNAQLQEVQQTLQQQPLPTLPPKRVFSKKLFLIIPFIVLISVFVFLLLKIKPGGLGSFGKKGEIVWWGFWPESTVLPLIAKYQDEHPSITIKYVTQSESDYRERLTNSLAKGTGPDIFRFHNSWVPMFTSELEPLPGSVMSQQDFNATYYPVIRTDLTANSGILGLPLGYDALTLYINEDLLTQAGASPPVTWDEFRVLASALTTKDRDGRIFQSGAAIGRTENIDHWQEILGLMMIQNGVNPANPKGQLAEDAVKFYTVFAFEDKVWDETLPPSTVAFANSKVAMYFGPSWRATEINSMNPSLRYKTVPLPQLRKDDPREPDVSYATYWVEGVWNKSTNKESAWDFLKFLSQRESLEALYDNLSQTRVTGEPYPRVDMGNMLTDNKILASIIALAPQAKSWYLADATNDGATGINSQLSTLFKQVIDNVIIGRDAGRELGIIAPDVADVLSKYGIRVK